MACHIIHLAVEAGGQPGLQLGFGGIERRAGDADRIEAQFPPPLPDARGEFNPVDGVSVLHSEDHSLSLSLPDEAATLALGSALSQTLAPGLVIWLEGDLGSGKTTLVRGVLRGLGYGGNVKSPTFTLVELYAISSLNLHHFDFYRFSQPEEYLDAGLDEYFQGGAICLVEWPDKAGEYLAPADLRIALAIADTGRRADFVSLTEAGYACLSRLRSFLSASAAATS